MTTIKLSKTSHVRNILAKNPTLPIKEVATRAKCDISMVYQIRKELASNKAIPQFDPLGIAPADLTYQVTKGRSKMEHPEPKLPIRMQAPVVSIKQACEVLLKAIDDIDGLDITMFANEIAFDLDGTKYVCQPSEVDRLLSAFKTIDSFVA